MNIIRATLCLTVEATYNTLDYCTVGVKSMVLNLLELVEQLLALLGLGGNAIHYYYYYYYYYYTVDDAR